LICRVGFDFGIEFDFGIGFDLGIGFEFRVGLIFEYYFWKMIFSENKKYF